MTKFSCCFEIFDVWITPVKHFLQLARLESCLLGYVVIQLVLGIMNKYFTEMPVDSNGIVLLLSLYLILFHMTSV